jgi:hypothetical protein
MKSLHFIVCHALGLLQSAHQQGFLALQLTQFPIKVLVLRICRLFTPLIRGLSLLKETLHHGGLEKVRFRCLLFDLLIGLLLLQNVHLFRLFDTLADAIFLGFKLHAVLQSAHLRGKFTLLKLFQVIVSLLLNLSSRKNSLRSLLDCYALFFFALLRFLLPHCGDEIGLTFRLLKVPFSFILNRAQFIYSCLQLNHHLRLFFDLSFHADHRTKDLMLG